MNGNSSKVLSVNPGTVSLSKKVITGALWATASTIFAKGLYVISAIILARLLAPEDFGLMALATAVITFSQGTTQTGMESAIIQKQDRPEDYLNTAWTFELLRNLIIFFILFLSAPFVATLFKEPRAVMVLRVLCFSILFQGIRNIGVVYFRKNLDFRKQFIFEFVPLIISITVAIALAYILKSVWALVWSTISLGFSMCCISYLLHPFRPRFDFNIERAKTLFGFGKWILGASVIIVIRDQGLNMFLGRLLGMVNLGFFNRANFFSTTVFQQLIEIVWKVGYPAYSQIQNDRERLKTASLQTVIFLSFIGFPLAGLIFVLIKDFVALFLTEKWLPIVPLIQIFCIQGFFNFVNTPATIVFQAIGSPGIGSRILSLSLFIILVSVYPLTEIWGIMGAAVSIFLASLLTSPIIWIIFLKTIDGSLKEYARPTLCLLCSVLIVVLIIQSLKMLLIQEVTMLYFFILLFLGCVTYLGIIFLFDRIFGLGINDIIRTKFIDSFI